jgi:hypothetical protein
MKNSKGCHIQKIGKIPESKVKENKERKPNYQPQIIKETITGSIAP